MAQENGKKRSLLMKLLIVVLVLLLLVMLAAVVAFNYVLGKFGRFEDDPAMMDTTPITDEFDPEEDGAALENAVTVDPTDISMEAVEELEGDVINVMLIGQDRRPGESRARSDTMILVSMNVEKGTLHLTSFMRDTYVQIPGYLDNRLNAAYRYGGNELMNETFLVNFGVKIDGNVMVDFDAFADIVEILGGVEVELTSSEANYMRRRGFPHLVTGVNRLNAEEANMFVRIRYLDSDYNRTARQRRFLMAIADSVKNADIITILELIDQILPCIVTNLTDAQIIEYATTGLSMLAGGAEIESLRIPANDAHYNASIRGMSVLVPDLEMCREDLAEFIYIRDTGTTMESTETTAP